MEDNAGFGVMAGWLVAVGALTVVAGFLIHPLGEGVSYEQTRQLVIEENALWRASHGIAAGGCFCWHWAPSCS